jgi:hypothetical protein
MLNSALPRDGCDRTRRLTEQWLLQRGHNVLAVLAWLDTQGGYCDCEVLANVEQRVLEAAKGSH